MGWAVGDDEVVFFVTSSNAADLARDDGRMVATREMLQSFLDGHSLLREILVSGGRFDMSVAVDGFAAGIVHLAADSWSSGCGSGPK